MIENGMRIAVFQETTSADRLEFAEFILATFDPSIRSWTR
jgi:hypothetical protein